MNSLEKNSSFDSLDNVRKKLLNLSNRNPLLNYKYTKTNNVRFVDVSPDDIYDALQKGNSLELLHVTEPTKEKLIETGHIKIDEKTKEKSVVSYPSEQEWAKYLGINTSYDLPKYKDTKHKFNLQSLSFLPTLDAKLRNLSNKSKIATDESGSNILYLVIGFLEWFEDDKSNLKHLAPLFTLPVKLEKINSGGYKISLQDEPLLSNTTLREKLANDFGLLLPTINDGTTPELYFGTIEHSILGRKSRWSICRHITLTLLNFTKQAMYQDLDPANWPTGKDNILNHPIIQKFFNSDKNDEASKYLSYQTEYAIDDVDNVHENFPLIYDADSSQHSALIDAINGDNLVIEGPPGTGKSQTITNLIAACIARGQRVLFLAEKMAALDVVKSRLDRAGLGDFCLELHSHKTNKQKILQNLNQQINNRQNYRVENINTDILRYEDLKNRLRYYADSVNAIWQKTGLTVHQILNRATRYHAKYKIDVEKIKIDGVNGETLTPIKQRELIDYADILANVFKLVSEQTKNGNITSHYWFGVYNINIEERQLESLLQNLQQWTASLQHLDFYWNQEINNSSNVTLELVQAFMENLSKLPELSDGKLLLELSSVLHSHENFSAWLDQYEQIHNDINNLKSIIKLDSSSQWSTIEQIIGNSLEQANILGIISIISLEQIEKDIQELSRLISLTSNIVEQNNIIFPSLPKELHSVFTPTVEGLTELQALLILMQKLPTNFWQYRSDIFDTSGLAVALENLSQLINTTKSVYELIKDIFDLNNLPAIHDVKKYQSVLSNAGLFKWFSFEWRSSRKVVLGFAIYKKLDEKLLNSLSLLVNYMEGIEKINQLKKETPILEDIYYGIETPITRIITIYNWYQEVREYYGLFGKKASIATTLFSLNTDLVLAINNIAKQSLQENIQNLLNCLGLFQKKYPLCSSLKNNQLTLVDDTNPFYILFSQLRTLLTPLIEIFYDRTLTFDQLNIIQQSIHTLQNKIQKWQQEKFIRQPSSQRLSISHGEFSTQSLAVSRNLSLIANVIADEPVLLDLLTARPTDVYYNEIKSKLPQLNILIEEINNHKKLFLQQGKVKELEWTILTDSAIQLLITRNQLAIDNLKWLGNWLDYVRIKEKLSKLGLCNVIHQLEMSEIGTESLSDIVQLVLYNQLSVDILSQNSYLAEFSGIEQMAIRTKYQEYDKKLLLLQREKIAYLASKRELMSGIATGKISQYTETALIQHEAGKRKKIIALRQLLKRANNAIQTLKPCFMMSPMSVAQYLDPSQFHFDLVIMDEASQIRPEDALGAIARGKRLVVVGDPKQLPPTSFFSKTLNDDDDDNEDTTVLEETVSILDAVIPMFKTRRLRWHYRSRHESLIAFSNARFYGADLILFPSPFHNSEEFGIRFLPMKGYFKNRRNIEEAKEAVKLAMEHLVNSSNESIGIVAMNSEQRDEIEVQIEQTIKNDPIICSIYEKNQNSETPLFIKNLENVQGDERDIIIISMTYGPEETKMRVMQRFGPINASVGWRRLNVLFTRSKKRMYILSSMSSGDIVVNSNSSEGIKSLKAFLEYCETGRLNQPKYTGKLPDSDFEIAVMQVLKKHGYDCEPQLGVAGYFLDIAVKDPNKPSRFIMGIECDGATYHSAKSTRDRDRLRQDVLESLGWRICRIWSTDWFKHPQAQLNPILQELDKLKS